MARARITTVLVAAVIAGITVAAPTPASADPPGIVKAGATSVSNSSDKTLTAHCPPNTVVSGGGGYLTAPASSGERMVGLDRLEPLNGGTGFTASMREVSPNPNNWRLSTDVTCITAPSGWDVVSFTGPLNTQGVNVGCGTKNVIGVGGRINNGNGDVILDHVVPSADLKTVSVRGTVVAGTAPVNWSVTAIAVCANVAGLERITSFVPSSSTAHKSLSQSCDAGDGLYSAGADISPGNGQMFLTMVRTTTVHQYNLVADEDVSGYNLNWVLFGYGICGG